MIRSPRARLSDDRAQSLVEFALASTVFFMTIFGILELGLAISRYNMVADLAQEGARWASVRGTNGGATPHPHATEADVSAFVVARAGGMPVTVTTTPSSGPGTLVAGQTIQVNVTTAYTPLTAFIPAGTINISSRAVMTISR
jgi:Flp pilus assembly protein TadG